MDHHAPSTAAAPRHEGPVDAGHAPSEAERSREGQLLTDAIRDEWRNEFTEGKDYQILKGEELRAFKAAVKANGRIPFAYASHVLVLYEPGVHLVDHFRAR